MKFWEKPGFKKLKEKWYAIIEKDGFVDVESDAGSRDYLKQWAGNIYKNESPVAREAKESYFSLLSSCAQREKDYSTVIDAIVMQQAALGISAQDIVAYLKVCGYSRERRTVGFIIRRYEHKWGIRKWTEKQMKIKPPTP
jgi:hypothetical protein